MTKENRALPEETTNPENVPAKDAQKEQEQPEDAEYAQSVLASAAVTVQMDAADTPGEGQEQVIAALDSIAHPMEAAPAADAMVAALSGVNADAERLVPAADFSAILASSETAEAETQGKANINILEGFVPTDGTDAREALPIDGAAVMDDPENVELSASARMPERNQKQTEPVQAGFLENVDNIPVTIVADGDDLPPPRRVEITQLSAQAAPQDAQALDAVEIRPVLSAEENAAAQEKQSGAAPKDAQPPVNAAAQAAPAQGSVFAPEGAPAQGIAPKPFEQIALEATLNQGVGRSSFTMRLNPETLGEVTVRLTLASDGVVARISVVNDSARAALSEQLYQLGDSMRAKGIDVRSIELVQDFGQSAMLHDGNRGSSDQNPTPRWRQTRFQGQAETVAALESYDQALIAQITVGDTQTVSFDA